MCMSGGGSPDKQAYVPPPDIAKNPDATPLLKKRNAAPTGPDKVANGTLLTGAAGVPNTALTLGGSTLLGGGVKQ